MTLDELKKYDGRDGAPAYVAYKNVVYDVSESPLWRGGEHQGMHNAGVDLTADLAGAPHGDTVFQKFPVVGTLQELKGKKATGTHTEKSLKITLGILYKKYHPHPMFVHFPIALHIFAAGLDLLFLALPKPAYAVGVFYSFFVATVMGFLAMIPGILSWWINYNFSKHYAFIVKFAVATLTICLGVIDIIIRLEHPNIAYEHSLLGIIYHAIILFTGFCVIVLGYYGGKISWGNILEESQENSSNKETLHHTT